MTDENTTSTHMSAPTQTHVKEKMHKRQFRSKLQLRMGIADKTLWDGAQFFIALASAIIIPLVILFVGQNFTQQQQISATDQQRV